MAYEIDPVEHGQILADIARLKEDVREGRVSMGEMTKRLAELEHRARQNDRDHERFTQTANSLAHIEASLKKIEDGTLVIDKKTAKENGDHWLKILTSNPRNVLWIAAAMVAIAMIFMGYSVAEIRSMLDMIQ